MILEIKIKNIKMNRDLPTLHMTCLKTIAKQPARYLNETRVKKVREAHLRFNGKERIFQKGLFDVCDTLVKYITDAGRFTDDAIPTNLFEGRVALFVKNSKVSSK